MGNSEDGKPCKPEKPPSPPPDQTNMHMYADWAAMQAYYGHRVAVPPYFNSALPPGHAPHPYMWGPPQAMMPPFGAPYAAIYAHGGVYAHPGVHPGVTLAATTPTTEAPGKSSGNTDKSLMKKLKGFDGLAMSIGSGNVDSSEGGAHHVVSQSTDTEGSSDGSNGNTTEEGFGQNGRKRSHERTPTLDKDGVTERKNNEVGKSTGASDKAKGPIFTPINLPGKVETTALSPPGMTTALELRNPSADLKTSPTSGSQPCAIVPNETWVQNDREIKRERRKQSNRESARRSRLRKQAETEELAIKVESLIAENTTLKSEMSRLRENSEKLKHENNTLMEKLKSKQIEQNEVGISNNGNKNSGVKLHQLLDTSPRTDAVAAR